MTRVALLWHMHQPFYQDLVTGEHVLPWVRLHALKDYWGMAALLREFPGVRLTFNLVPSLLVQLEAFARDEARDPHLAIGLKDAGQLTAEERAFCVENFFHAHHEHMIAPYPRYAELLEQRGVRGAGGGARAAAGAFSIDDLRDLQVWHKLAWIDPEYLEHDPRAAALVRKGRGFTEEDKRMLRGVELELLGRVLPEYRAVADRGQVELSTSPFYHPILPLLCDTDVHLRMHPESRMPRVRFRHPEDALEQLNRAVTLHERVFGRRPAGVWPSEGSVSDETVALLARAGFQWMATDEEILARTLSRDLSRDGAGRLEQPEALYRAYRVGGAESVACAFRDHALSDLIGFTYASWAPEDAAAHFVDRVADAGARVEARGGGEATVFVILDGENAWEHYAGQGRPFLRALYRRFGTDPRIRTVTMSEACAEPAGHLPSIFPGSWINGDFYIWIGHADDHRAWSQLADARRAFESREGQGVPAAALAEAREELLIAEGSDWFWWYGDDHSSDHDRAFDELFRRHVRNVYRALGLPIPEELFVTNISTERPAVPVQPPTGSVSAVIDGEVSSYFEWLGAGLANADPSGGAMHQVSGRGARVSAVRFGCDAGQLYIRLDCAEPASKILAEGADLLVAFLKPAGLRVLVRVVGRTASAAVARRAESGGWEPIGIGGVVAAVGAIVEIGIPSQCLNVGQGEAVAFFVAVVEGEHEVERHPRHGPIELTIPGRSHG